MEIPLAMYNALEKLQKKLRETVILFFRMGMSSNHQPTVMIQLKYYSVVH